MTGWLGSARRGLASAQLMLDVGDGEGAANRAYFSLFYATLALLSERYGHDVKRYKTHSTVHSKLGESAVRTGEMPVTISKLIKGAETLRLRADYDADAVEVSEVAEMVASAAVFLAEVERLLALPRAKT